MKQKIFLALIVLTLISWPNPKPVQAAVTDLHILSYGPASAIFEWTASSPDEDFSNYRIIYDRGPLDQADTRFIEKSFSAPEKVGEQTWRIKVWCLAVLTNYYARLGTGSYPGGFSYISNEVAFATNIGPQVFTSGYLNVTGVGLNASAITNPTISWKNPTVTEWSATTIIRKKNNPRFFLSKFTPSADEVKVYSGRGTAYVDAIPADGVYYYSLFSHNADGAYNSMVVAGIDSTNGTVTVDPKCGRYLTPEYDSPPEPPVNEPVNEAPKLDYIGDKTVIEENLLTFTISGTDPEGAALTYSASNLPPGATFNASTRTFSWTPTHAQIGVYPGVRFTVSDGSLTDYEDITITVAPKANNAPTLNPLSDKVVYVGETLTFTLGGFDPDGDPLTFSGTNMPTGATLHSVNGTFTWTPTAAQVGVYPNVTFSVSDGKLSDSGTITITVLPSLQNPPVLDSIGNKTVVVGNSLVFVVTATDADGDPLTYSVSNLPAGATFNTSNGTFSWTPTISQVGSYPGIIFSVSDGALTDSESVTITVVAPNNNPPVLNGIGDKVVTENENLSFTIFATDPESDPLTYSATNLPPGSTFDPVTRTFSWTPTSAQVGEYAGVTFSVADAFATDSESITITVLKVAPPGPHGNRPDGSVVRYAGQTQLYVYIGGILHPIPHINIWHYNLADRLQADMQPDEVYPIGSIYNWQPSSMIFYTYQIWTGTQFLTRQSARWLVLDDGKRFEMSDAEVIYDFGYDGFDWHLTPQDLFNLIPQSSVTTLRWHPTNTAVKFQNDPTYYMIKDAIKIPISGPNIFLSRWLNFDLAVNPPPLESQTVGQHFSYDYPSLGVPLKFPSGHLVKNTETGDPTIYLIDGDFKRPIASMDAFNRWGFILGSVGGSTTAELNLHPTGSPIL